MEDTLPFLVFSEEAKIWFRKINVIPTYYDLLALWNVLTEEDRNHYLTTNLPLKSEILPYHLFVKEYGTILFEQNPGIYRVKAVKILRSLWKVEFKKGKKYKNKEVLK